MVYTCFDQVTEPGQLEVTIYMSLDNMIQHGQQEVMVYTSRHMVNGR